MTTLNYILYIKRAFMYIYIYEHTHTQTHRHAHTHTHTDTHTHTHTYTYTYTPTKRPNNRNLKNVILTTFVHPPRGGRGGGGGNQSDSAVIDWTEQHRAQMVQHTTPTYEIKFRHPGPPGRQNKGQNLNTWWPSRESKTQPLFWLRAVTISTKYGSPKRSP